MATPSSGAISLNEMHVEAGGSSGTTCSINDTDIRLIANKSSGATASWNDYYSRAKDFTTVVTVGGTNVTTTGDYSSTIVRYRGYLNSSPSGASNIGSLSVASDADYFSNNGFLDLVVHGTQGASPVASPVRIRVSAVNVPNSDTSFKSVVIGSTTFNRTDMTYETSNGRSQWYVSTNTAAPTDDTSAFAPFAAAGSTTTVVFRRSR